jgi:PAS domain S-box-containing protein
MRGFSAWIVKQGVRGRIRWPVGVAKGLAQISLTIAFCLLTGILSPPCADADGLPSRTVPGSPDPSSGTVTASLSRKESKAIALTDEESAWLRAHRVIRVVQDPGWPPVEFADDRGRPSGISEDYLNLVEKRLGVAFQRVRGLSWQEAYGRLRKWELDMTVSVARTPDREIFWAFTKPYMSTPIVILTENDVTYIDNMRELKGKKVAVVDGYAVNDWIPRDYPDIRLVKVKNTREALDLLERGEVFAYIDNMLVVSYYISKLKLANLKIAGTTPYVNAQSMAVRKDWPILTGILQKALDSISPAERSEIYQKWVPVRYEHGFNYTRVWQVLGVCAVIFAALLVRNRRLAREVRHRRQTEDALNASERNLRLFLDRAPAAIAMFDREMRYLAASRQWFIDYRLEGQDIIGRSHYEVFPEIPERIRQAHARGLDGATERCEEDPFRRSDGRTDWVRWEMVPWYEQSGAVGGIIIFTEDISQRKQAEEAFIRNEAKFRSYIESSPLAVFVADREGTILDVNRAAVELLGYDAATLTQMHVWELHPVEDREEAVAALASFNQYGSLDTAFRFQKRDGTLLWVSVRATTLGDGLALSYCSDITSHKLAEETLRTATDRLMRAEEVSRTGNWELDLSTRVIHASLGATRIYGLEGQEWPLSDVQSVPLPEYREKLNSALRALVEENTPYDVEFRIQRPGADTVLDVHSVAEYDAHQKTVFGVIRDVTDRKKLEDQLRQAQKMEAIGTLAGGVAHDFNNILTVITGFGNLAQMAVAPDDRLRQYIDQIVLSAGRASELTQSLLAFSRKQKISLDPHQVNTAITQTAKLLKRLLTEDVELKLDLVAEDEIILVDIAQFDQVLMNLATNARDAMPHGGSITIGTQITQIDEEFRRAHGFGKPGEYVRISFSDTGFGMDEKTMARIFDPFFTTKEVGKGTGLGLASVYGIVKQHGGYITVSSRLREGTTFHIYLPLVVMSQRLQAASVEVRGGSETVLVVEDDADVRQMIATVLAGQGYATLSAVDGKDGIRVFTEHRNSIDLVILDVVMPGRNGKEVFDEIRKMEPQTKVIFVSGYTGDIVLDKGVEKDHPDLIQKPLSIAKLLTKVREVLDR